MNKKSLYEMTTKELEKEMLDEYNPIKQPLPLNKIQASILSRILADEQSWQEERNAHGSRDYIIKQIEILRHYIAIQWGFWYEQAY